MAEPKNINDQAMGFTNSLEERPGVKIKLADDSINIRIIFPKQDIL